MNPVEKIAHVADRVQQRYPWLAFPTAVWKKFGDDQAGNLAALISYYGFASLFPLLLVFVTVLDVTMRSHPAFRETLINSALAQYPVIGDQIKSNIHTLAGTGAPLTIGVVLLFLGARGVASAMQNALNTVWSVPLALRPGFPWSVLRSVALVLTIGAGLVITGFLSGLAAGTGSGLVSGIAAHIGLIIASLVVNIGVFGLAFRLATARCVPWRNLWPGAILAAAVWQILLSAGGYIVAHQLHRASSLYGTFGIVLGLLAWLFLQAEATLYAAEANVVLVRKLWPRSLVPPPYTEQDRDAFRLYAETQQRDLGDRIDVTEDNGNKSADGSKGADGDKIADGGKSAEGDEKAVKAQKGANGGK